MANKRILAIANGRNLGSALMRCCGATRVVPLSEIACGAAAIPRDDFAGAYAVLLAPVERWSDNLLALLNLRHAAEYRGTTIALSWMSRAAFRRTHPASAMLLGDPALVWLKAPSTRAISRAVECAGRAAPLQQEDCRKASLAAFERFYKAQQAAAHWDQKFIGLRIGFVRSVFGTGYADLSFRSASMTHLIADMEKAVGHA